jgi:solute carrier family 13 (sodium-dependent dicarboxylate transporter), member 2/3/5
LTQALVSRWGIWLGLAVFVALLLLPPPADLSPAAWRTAALGALMAIWWFSEAVPIAATALLPFAVLPLLGVASPEATAKSYMAPVVFLVFAGSLVAIAIERSGLHKRVAVGIVRAGGASPQALILSMMSATAFISMWASNTATMLFMLPIAATLIVAVTGHAGDVQPEGDARRFASALVIGLAYGASLGGFGTVIASPSNAIAAGLIEKGLGTPISFLGWMAFGVPIILIGVPLGWWVLAKLCFRFSLQAPPREVVLAALEPPGQFTPAERLLLPVMASLIAAWMTMPLLQSVLPAASDAGVAVLAVLLLFLLPAGGKRLLVWDDTKAVPWGILVLVGGGLALADAMTQTGLSAWLGERLGGLAGWPTLLLLVVFAGLIVAITEFASNIATTAAFVPAAIALAQAAGLDPLMLAMLAAFAAKWGFIVPAGTPWMALALTNRNVRMTDMMRAGVWMDLAGIVLMIGVCWGASRLLA